MNLHEYQAKELLAQKGGPILPGGVAQTPAEAVRIAQAQGGQAWAVKAQIHAGGRGKGGGIRVVHTLEAVEAAAAQMLGMMLVTPQTPPQGLCVRRVYVEACAQISQEFYFALLVDRATKRVVAVVSPQGGMDIEVVAARTPDAVHKVFLDPHVGLQTEQISQLAAALGLGDAGAQRAFADFVTVAYATFIHYDVSLLEVNPLILTPQGDLWVLDAKISVDDNALFRQPAIRDLRERDGENATEIAAQEQGLSYVQMDGNIGCLVNGAGLAMATMDLIQLSGARPANFMDIGGGATRERVAIALKMILADPKVACVLVNIFGGIMRCDVVANGIVAAAKEVGVRVPLIVRLAGTHAAQGRQILQDAGLNIQSVDGLKAAAQHAVAAVKGV